MLIDSEYIEEEVDDDIVLCDACPDEEPQPAEVQCQYCEAPLCLTCAIPAEESSYWGGLPPDTFYCPGTDHDRLEAGEDPD